MNKRKIDFLIEDLNYISTFIRLFDDVITNQYDDAETKDIALEQMAYFVYQFEEVSRMLKIELEKFFNEEKRENRPIDLGYRQIYKSLTKEL